MQGLPSLIAALAVLTFLVITAAVGPVDQRHRLSGEQGGKITTPIGSSTKAKNWMSVTRPPWAEIVRSTTAR
jgi:hypothetical protein